MNDDKCIQCGHDYPQRFLAEGKCSECIDSEQDNDYYSQEDIEEMQNAEPDYWYCECCNHTQVKPSMGRGCDNCGMFNVMAEGYF